ncbi:MAG: LytTR family DNA-binding domain-containing protein [Lachnospiraceae bacterium]|nr:LytTR family DNA-binding domain-containing protein [Lachnospiraceae bacterium]
MITVAIVEDSIESADILKNYIKRFEEEERQMFHVTHFSDALSFLDGYTGFDLVFMDIDMPFLNGMDGALRLREKDKSTVLIFVTNLANYAVRGYEADALDFIVKPVSFADFRFKLLRALHVIDSRKSKEITIVQKDGMKRFEVSDLLYVEVRGHQLTYVLSNRELKVRGTIVEAEQVLKGYGFLRPHNAYLVNARFIDEVTGNEIRLKGHILPVSRPRKKEFLQELAKWYGKGSV